MNSQASSSFLKAYHFHFHGKNEASPMNASNIHNNYNICTCKIRYRVCFDINIGSTAAWKDDKEAEWASPLVRSSRGKQNGIK